ncbi:MAG: hypothetical protein AAB529_01030 [Patescibacteria group bacterium]
MEENKNENIRELIIARLEVMPDDKSISIGSDGDFTKDQLIEHVKSGDELGQKIIGIQMDYLRILKDKFFYGENFIDNKTET